MDLMLGMNPNSAGAGGQQITTLSENFATLQKDLTAIVEACITAAGDLPVAGGYGQFGEIWATDLAATAAHGQSVGGATVLTVNDGVATDTENAELQTVAAPGVAASGIKPI